jgi:hypothetical protein
MKLFWGTCPYLLPSRTFRSSSSWTFGPPVNHEDVAPPPSPAQGPDTRGRVSHIISKIFQTSHSETFGPPQIIRIFGRAGVLARRQPDLMVRKTHGAILRVVHEPAAHPIKHETFWLGAASRAPTENHDIRSGTACRARVMPIANSSERRNPFFTRLACAAR